MFGKHRPTETPLRRVELIQTLHHKSHTVNEADCLQTKVITLICMSLGSPTFNEQNCIILLLFAASCINKQTNKPAFKSDALLNCPHIEGHVVGRDAKNFCDITKG